MLNSARFQLVVLLLLLFGFTGLAPSGTIDPSDLLVSQLGPPDGILRFDDQTGAFVQIFASGGSGDHFGIAYGPDGNLYAGRVDATITRYNGLTGASMGTFATGAGGAPTGLAFGSDGHLYVVVEGPDVKRYNGVTGAFMGAFVPAGTGGLARSEDLTFGPDGNLYVADSENDRVLRYDGGTGAFIDIFVSDPGIGFLLLDIMFGPDEHLYILDTNESVRKYNGLSGAFMGVHISSGAGGLEDVFKFTFGPDGHIYIPNVAFLDPSDYSIRRFNGQTGEYMGVFVSNGSGGLNFPFDLLFAPECFANADCDDQSICTGSETCLQHNCVAGSPLICDDQDVCTTDSCNAASGCSYVNNTAPCDDGDDCTLNDRCSNGDCVGQPAGNLLAYDVAPCAGNGIIDIDDILGILNAFSGNYTCSVPCP